MADTEDAEANLLRRRQEVLGATPAVMRRQHDLPPAWDGFAVEWRGWAYLVPAIVCPPPPSRCCTNCGAAAVEKDFPTIIVNRGYVARLGGKPPQFRLHAFRCQACSHDVVWDTSTGENWDLGDPDYGDDGSDAPLDE